MRLLFFKFSTLLHIFHQYIRLKLQVENEIYTLYNTEIIR